MEIILAIVIGVLYATGLYMLFRRSLVKLLIGLSLLGHAANLLIFTVAGLGRGLSPVIPETTDTVEGSFANPLPQALILTAIVIGLGVIAFAMALSYRVYRTTGVEDLDLMTTSDQFKE